MQFPSLSVWPFTLPAAVLSHTCVVFSPILLSYKVFLHYLPLSAAQRRTALLWRWQHLQKQCLGNVRPKYFVAHSSCAVTCLRKICEVINDRLAAQGEQFALSTSNSPLEAGSWLNQSYKNESLKVLNSCFKSQPILCITYCDEPRQ